MTTQEEFDASKKRLEELSEAHRQAVAKVGEIKIQLDDAATEAMRLLDKLEEENERYTALEKQLTE